MNTPLPAARPVALAALCLALASPAFAQQQPVTGQMMDGRTQASVAAPAPSAPPATAPVAAPASQALPPPAQAPMVMSRDDMTPPPPPAYERGIDSAGIGSTTRELLHMQVSGSHAGPRLPMLGDEASASYQRYIQSFNHPIPEFFESKVGKDSNSSGR